MDLAKVDKFDGDPGSLGDQVHQLWAQRLENGGEAVAASLVPQINEQLRLLGGGRSLTITNVTGAEKAQIENDIREEAKKTKSEPQMPESDSTHEAIGSKGKDRRILYSRNKTSRATSPSGETWCPFIDHIVSLLWPSRTI